MSDRRALCLKGCRLLVIEDEYFLADDLEKALRDSGAEVIGPVGECSDAMRLIERHGLDVAVLDIKLHDELAYSLADELERQAIPFVFATGYGAEVIPDRYSHIARWRKPYELADIVDGLMPLCCKKPAPIAARTRV